MSAGRGHVFVRRTTLDAPVEEVFAWHARPGAFERLNPPWGPMRMVRRSGGIEQGARTELSVRAGPLRARWVSVHVDYERDRVFRDVQATGPFARWDHTHRFEAAGPDRCVMEDRVEYELPFGAAGDAVAARYVARELERIFGYRHRTLAGDLRAHRLAALPPARIAMTGASGFIASALRPLLTTGGHSVVPVVRRRVRRGEDAISWGPGERRIDPASLEGLDAVVHLAGASVARPWTRSGRELILRSRVDGTRTMAEALASLREPPRVLLCASADGYYGDGGDALLSEDAPPGEGFLASVVREWEAAAEPARRAGIRVVHARIGLVLSPSGGVLARLLLPFGLGAGVRLGGGAQWWSWVTLDDAAGAFLHALADARISGAVNVVAPHPVRQAEFASTLSRVLGRPAGPPLPAVAVRTLLRDLGRETLLFGRRLEPARLAASGFEFRHPVLEPALRHVLGRMGRVM